MSTSDNASCFLCDYDSRTYIPRPEDCIVKKQCVIYVDKEAYQQPTSLTHIIQISKDDDPMERTANQYKSKPPCATMAKFKAALPKLLKEWDICPPGIPPDEAGAEARRRNEVDLPVMVGTARSEPHSTANIYS
jgi:hypothetical protein